MENIEEIRKRLEDAYRKSGKTYAKLEQQTGIGHSIIQRYITGKTKKISLDDFLALCYAIGTDPRTILGWDNEKDNPSTDELIQLTESLSDKDKETVLEYARFVASREQKQ